MMISVLVSKLSSLGFSCGYVYNTFLWAVVLSVSLHPDVFNNYYSMTSHWI